MYTIHLVGHIYITKKAIAPISERNLKNVCTVTKGKLGVITLVSAAKHVFLPSLQEVGRGRMTLLYHHQDVIGENLSHFKKKINHFGIKTKKTH